MGYYRIINTERGEDTLFLHIITAQTPLKSENKQEEENILCIFVEIIKKK